MRKMRAAVITEPDGPIQVVELDVPQPGAGQVLVKVQACGICHSDALTKEGLWPGLQYPRVPGHEIAGVIDALGPGVEGWQTGARVGVGWYGGHCGHCAACRSGDFVLCEQGQVPGISYDAGYAQYMVAPVEALACIPQDLSDVDAAPLLCAGITTFNALRNSGARRRSGGGPRSRRARPFGCAVRRELGFRTVAIARGEGKALVARELGAHEYIDSTASDPAEALKAMGGAKVVLATVTSGDAMSAVVPGLGRNGKLLIVGVATEPLQVPTVPMIMNRTSIQGWPSGTAQDSTETLAFSAMAKVRPMIEEYPLERAAEAYERMMSGGARFRVVLKMDGSTTGRR